jgi:hypothetical protein
MESITIDGKILPLTFDGFHKLTWYEKYIYVKILNTERLYRRYVYNDRTSDTYINICNMLDFGYDELNSDDGMDCQERYLSDLKKYQKNHIDNCECPYQYRSFFIYPDNMSSYSDSYCRCCRKKRTIDTMKKEELVKKRKCGLYLASDLSSENVLNVLPNDISKYVVQYI